MAALSAFLLGALSLSTLQAGSLAGHVINSANGAPIPGAKFRMCAYPGEKIYCSTADFRASTDNAGAFRINNVPDGPYLIFENSAEGFLVVNSPTVAVSGDSTLDFPMTPFASLRGRVFDPDGNPAPGVSVRLLPFGPAATTTDSNGEFMFKTVQPGNFFTLSAAPKPQPSGGAVKDGTRIVTTYYPSVIDSAQAQKITVAGIDAVYDIRLRTAPARAIRGAVIGVDGKPATTATVVIEHAERSPVSLVRGIPSSLPQAVTAAQPVETANDGTFAFPPVMEGEWNVRATILRFAERLHGNEIQSGSAKVSVSARGADTSEIRNVEIRLAQPFDLSVTADWGDAPHTDPPTPFSLASVIPLDPQADPEPSRHPTREPGQPQQIHLSPGRYFIGEGRTIGFGAAPGFYAAAALLDGRDVLGQVVELSGPASLKMIYKSGGGSFHGMVEKGPNSMVLLMADPSLDAVTGFSARCDSSGAFSLPDLPPGSYTAVALAAGSRIDPLTPAFTAALARDGKRVKIETGTAAQVDLRLALMQ